MVELQKSPGSVGSGRHMSARCSICRRAGYIGEHISPGVYVVYCDQHYDDGADVMRETFPPEWTKRAACQGADISHASRSFVDRNCVRCPVWPECLDLALAHEGHKPKGSRDAGHAQYRYFIYGGLTPAERARHPEDARAFAGSKLFERAMHLLRARDGKGKEVEV